MIERKREGFWYSKEEPQLPHPISHLRPPEGKAEFLEALEKKEARAQSKAFKGSSTCRLCLQRNGSQEYSAGGWTWPSGYRHYVLVHNVVPSHQFRAFVTGVPKKESAASSWIDQGD